MHGDGVSYSPDAGATWRVLDGPVSPFNMSTVAGQGLLISRIAGEAWLTEDLTGFRQLEFEAIERSEIPIVNGDFETGDLSGWTVASGDAPTVLDTTHPPQRGGRHYLSRDWALSAEGGFVLEQSLPAPRGDQPISVSADMLAQNGTATLEVLGAVPYPVVSTNSTWHGNTLTGYATAPGGAPLDLVVEGGGLDGITSDDSGGTKTIALRYQDGSLYDAPWMLCLMDVDNFEEIVFDEDDFGGLVSAENSGIFFSIGSNSVTVASSSNNQQCAVVMNSGRVTFDLDLLLSRIGFTPSPALAELLGSAEASYTVIGSTEWSGNAWTRRTVTGYATGGAQDLTIRLSGTGDPANVYFDNVKIHIEKERNESVSVVARDLATRRHVVATQDSLHAVYNGNVWYIAPAPFRALHAAAHGEFVVLADAAQVASSTDGGSNFMTVAQAGIIQVLAHPWAIFVLETGEIRTIHEDGSSKLLLTADPGASLAWDAKRQVWFITGAGGVLRTTRDFKTFEAHSTMPQSDGAGNDASDRRVLPLDVGRLIGWVPNTRDLFHFDETTGAWKVSLALTKPIQEIQEIK